MKIDPADNAARERSAMCAARKVGPMVLMKIEFLHRVAWKLDSEIGEALGLDRLTVWHARQFNDINRHKPGGSAPRDAAAGG